MKQRKIGIVMDPIESVNRKKDTTVALMYEAQARGWEVYYLTLTDLCINSGCAEGTMRRIHLNTNDKDWYQVSDEVRQPLQTLDVVLMRKDPPFDIEYVMATYILELAERDGVLVLNSPRALRDVNEKVYTAWLPDCCPPGLVARSGALIREFITKHGKVVLKPTCKMGGQSIYVVSDGDTNANVIIEDLTQKGNQYIQVQQYIPDIATTGDKRILLINGDPVPCGIARIPAAGDHRGNLAAGAQAKGFELSERDKWLCSKIGPALRGQKIFFAGIDVIGDYVTEINVTSPTGVREIESIYGINVPSLFFDALPL